MKKLVLALLMLPLFAAAAEAGDGSLRLYETGNNVEGGCLVGGAVGLVAGAANSVAEHRPTKQLFLGPVIGCTAGGVAFGVGDAALAAEAPPQDELQADAPADEE